MSETENILKRLIDAVAIMEQVQAIGISGTIKPLPKAGEGDIDIFIYCTDIPGEAQRRAMLDRFGMILDGSKIGVFAGGHWGVGDYTEINGVETWLMYFTMDEASCEIEDILGGSKPGRADGYFFPVARLAMLKNMNIMFERDGFLQSIKDRLAVYPEELAKKSIVYHLEQLDDAEDLLRAVTREDPLFYHFALEPMLDHLLMALFALNREYFPSRKRSLEYIQKFNSKPEDCGKRLLEMVRLGGEGKRLRESFELFRQLAGEIKALCKEANEGI